MVRGFNSNYTNVTLDGGQALMNLPRDVAFLAFFMLVAVSPIVLGAVWLWRTIEAVLGAADIPLYLRAAIVALAVGAAAVGASALAAWAGSNPRPSSVTVKVAS
mgnify:CR=1 FL=1